MLYGGWITPGSLSRADSASYHLGMLLWHAHEDDPYSRIGIDIMDFGFDRRPDVGFCGREDWDCVGRCILHHNCNRELLEATKIDCSTPHIISMVPTSHLSSLVFYSILHPDWAANFSRNYISVQRPRKRRRVTFTAFLSRSDSWSLHAFPRTQYHVHYSIVFYYIAWHLHISVYSVPSRI